MAGQMTFSYVDRPKASTKAAHFLLGAAFLNYIGTGFLRLLSCVPTVECGPCSIGMGWALTATEERGLLPGSQFAGESVIMITVSSEHGTCKLTFTIR